MGMRRVAAESRSQKPPKKSGRKDEALVAAAEERSAGAASKRRLQFNATNMTGRNVFYQTSYFTVTWQI